MATAPPVSDTLSVATSLCVKWSHVGSVASNVVSWFPPQLFRFSCTQPAQWILTTGTEQTRLKSLSLSSSPPLPPRSMEIWERWPLYPAARLFIHVTIVIPSPVVHNTNTACLSPSERVPGLQHLKCKCQHCQAINFSATINWALTICLDYPMLWGKKKIERLLPLSSLSFCRKQVNKLKKKKKLFSETIMDCDRCEANQENKEWLGVWAGNLSVQVM